MIAITTSSLNFTALLRVQAQNYGALPSKAQGDRKYIKDRSKIDHFQETYETIRQTVFNYKSTVFDKNDFPNLSTFEQSIILHVLIDYLETENHFKLQNSDESNNFVAAYDAISQYNELFLDDNPDNTMKFIMSMD